MIQEAQLSQRDRATAAWVSFWPKCNWREYYVPNLYRSLFNHGD